ncbi:PaaI family thioesterase [Hyphococcus luteus]|uniref:Thioesterase n=1 Tax=Hyphococcus luteus TaxID=2058213 RepID=A0A2S7K9G0_9PROT|nr:PaaI family thioesterase [Marinicaulis flavus]PQA89146.1 thioesterase [Marinicaulis flavus]
MTRTTSARHTDILNGYKEGGSRFNDWAREKLGEFTLLDWSWGHIKMRWEIDDRFVMPDGVMFGGHIASVADHVAGLAAMTVLTADKERFRTSRLETNYFRPLTMPLAMIEGRVVNAAKTLIHVEADFKNAQEKLAVRVNAVQVRRMTG